MKTLFDEMIPEVKQKLLADKEKYPNRHEGIMDDINKSILVSDLSINTAMALVNYLPFTESNDSFVIKLYKVFGR